MNPRRSRRVRMSCALVATGSIAVALALASPASAAPRPVDLQILSFNDYHGHLQPPAGTADGTVTLPGGGTTPAGGVEYLTTKLDQLRAGHRNSLTVAAGDLIGGSPFLSGLFKDEPSVESLNNLGLDISSVGNHEFDEGVPELLRMQYGGCHPVEGCFDADGYSGAEYEYLAANVVYKPGVTPPRIPGHREYGSWFRRSTGRTVLPPTSVRTVQGIKVGFIGMTLEGTPELVAQAGIQDVDFKDEVATANLAARDLRRRGVEAIVVLLHEGGLPPAGASYAYRCNEGGAGALSGPIIGIAENLSPSIDLVVTGHTHSAYVCNIPDPSGKARYVTSAQSYGRLVTDTNLQLSRRTRDVVRTSVTTQNVPVTRDVPADATQTATIAKWNGLSAPIANRVIGSITADILRGAGNRRDVETPLGDLIADAQLAATTPNGAVLALMNPGGVRADLTYGPPTAGEQPGQVTYGEAFTVQPFGNLLVTLDLTGAQIEQVLEQQWATRSGVVSKLHLGVSAGLTYSYTDTLTLGDHIDPSTIKLNGTTIDPAATYRVTVNSFLADGGDSFTALTQGTNRTGGGGDLEALIAYLGTNAPVAPPVPNRTTPLP